MMDILEKYLRDRTRLKAVQIDRIRSLGQGAMVQKGQVLSNPDYQYHTLVLNGYLRCYRFGRDGTEHTIRFMQKGSWISSQLGLPPLLPQVTTVSALVESRVMRWSTANIDLLRSEMPGFDALFRQVAIQHYQEMEERIFSTISSDAVKR